MKRFLGAFLLVMVAGPALAQNEVCGSEVKPFFDKKAALEGQLKAISKNSKRAGAREKFCSTMGAYIGNMRGLVGYMEKNKDFCGIAAEQVGAAKKGLAQNITLRKRVCSGPPPQARPRAGNGGPTVPPPPVKLQLM